MHLFVEIIQEDGVLQGSSSFTKCHRALFCSMCLVTGAVRASASSAVTSRVTECGTSMPSEHPFSIPLP